jgi:hypothetical protein
MARHSASKTRVKRAGVPAISIDMAQSRINNRDRRDKPGDDLVQFG